MVTELRKRLTQAPFCAFEGKEFFGDYYINPNNASEILVRFGVPFEVNFFCSFKIIKKGDLFLLRRVRFEDGKRYSQYKIAGTDIGSARKFMINKILAETMPNKFEDPFGEVEKKLEEVI